MLSAAGMGVVSGIVSLGLVVAVVLLGAPSDADACSPYPDGVQGRRVLPHDGANDVPRNTRVIVHYDIYRGSPGSTITLREAGGADVAVTVAQAGGDGVQYIVTPVAPLAPSTTYEVLDNFSFECSDAGMSGCLAEPAVVRTFTTGTVLDLTPPVLTDVTLAPSYHCFEGTSCSGAANVVVDQVRPIVGDEPYPMTWIYFEYLDAAGEVLVGPTPLISSGRGCGGGYGEDAPVEFVYTPRQVWLRAVDLAGNLGEAHALVGGSCEELVIGTACDPAGGLDGGAGGDGGAAGDAGGCGCATGQGPGGVGGGGLVALGVLFGRGRRGRGRRRSRA